MPSILLIEDHPDITRIVRDELEQAGYRVMSAPNGVTGLSSARENDPDLVILDLGLPDFDGAGIAQRLRKTSRVPSIVLTAVDELGRKVNLFAAGADDDLTKPFHPEELLARVMAQFRTVQRGDGLSIGALEIDPQERRCHSNGCPVPLSPREFDLLLFLARQPGREYSRREIEREVWKGEWPGHSDAVDVHRANLRAKLREVDGYGVIRTVRKLGYALRMR